MNNEQIILNTILKPFLEDWKSDNPTYDLMILGKSGCEDLIAWLNLLHLKPRFILAFEEDILKSLSSIGFRTKRITELEYCANNCTASTRLVYYTDSSSFGFCPQITNIKYHIAKLENFQLVPLNILIAIQIYGKFHSVVGCDTCIFQQRCNRQCYYENLKNSGDLFINTEADNCKKAKIMI